MEKKTMGNFMAALRKANGYTQQQIADKLNVSNKTVSKWECDDGYPEISMLPAIAEIYGVTVDELLRGEKRNQTDSTETNTQKGQAQIKYLFDRAVSKLKVCFIVSLGLGLFALALSYALVFQMATFNYSAFGTSAIFAGSVIPPLLFCIASIMVIGIGFNNFIENLKNQDIIDKQEYEKQRDKAVKRFAFIIALTVAIIGVIICAFVFDVSVYGYILILTAIVLLLGVFVGFLSCQVLRKKYNISVANISQEKYTYRKKHNKITSIVLLGLLSLTLILPISIYTVDSYIPYSFSFAEYVGEEYKTQEDAKRDYFKVKNHITKKEKLYFFDLVLFSEEKGKYYAITSRNKYLYNYIDNEGYKFYYKHSGESEGFYCNSKEEMKDVIYKSKDIYGNELLPFDDLKKEVNFDDETLTVNYKKGFSKKELGYLYDEVFFYALCELLIILVVSAIIYKRKSKNL